MYNIQDSKSTKASFYKKYFLFYTATFSLMCFFLVLLFIKDGYSLLRDGDSYTQHLKALIYYADYIREIFSLIFKEHRFIIPQWDFEIGMGSDIISTFSYYVLGDPFNFPSVFVPEKYIHIYYQAMIIIRLYSAGAAFSFLCFYMENKNSVAVTAGALTYCFSSYAVYAGLKHAYFINPMIFLPLLIIGAEKVFRGKNTLFFTAAVALSALSNFYFFYMLVILTVVYVTIRLISLYKKDMKLIFCQLCKLTLSSINGVLLSAVILLPTIITFLSDRRSSVQRDISLFYPVETYIKLILSFFTYGRASTWLAVCVSAVFFPCLISLFIKRKKNTELKAMYLIALVFMSIPFFGTFFNGFSYICHRWCFGYVLLVSFIISEQWNDFISSSKKELLFIISLSIAAAGFCFYFGDNCREQLLIPFILLFVTLSILFLCREIKNKKAYIFKNAVCLIFCITAALNYNFFHIYPTYGNYRSEFFTAESANSLSYASNNAMLEASENDSDFFRYSGRKLALNSSFIDSLKSTQFYWSLSNGNISDFRSEMNIAENILYKYEGFDDRTVLNALASVKYFYNGRNNNTSLPYGFERLTDTVSLNKYALPLGYTYDKYISREEYNKLDSSVKKQEIMLSAALLEKDTLIIPETAEAPMTKEQPYNIIFPDKKVKIKNGDFVVKKKNGQVEFVFDAVPGSETYICFSGTDCHGTKNKKNVFSLDSLDAEGNKYSKSFFYYTPDTNFYSGRKDFDINLGYTESGICKVILTFPYKGTYKFDSIRILSQPMTGYEKAINKLKEDVLENIILDYNTVSGTIKLDENKLLCLSIPFSKGWRAFVDSEETEILKTNGMYSGILLKEGEHSINLVYTTPGLKSGALLSLLGLAFFIISAYYYKRKLSPDKNRKLPLTEK